MLKKCRICQNEQPIENFRFRSDKTRVDGSKIRICNCNNCEAKRIREWRKRFSERYKSSSKKYLSKIRETRMNFVIWKRAEKRARYNDLEFNILPEDVLIPEFCPILGIKLNNFNARKEDNSPSLDRIDNSKGYIKGNIMVISSKANTIKSNGTSDEHRKIADYIDKYLTNVPN